MKKQNKKSLALSTETVRTISEASIAGVAGGNQTAPLSQCGCPSWDKPCSGHITCGGGGHTTI
jgi:hypothetical protein